MIFKSINLVNQDPSAVSTSKGEKGIGIRVKGDSEVMHDEVDKSWFLKKYIFIYKFAI